MKKILSVLIACMAVFCSHAFTVNSFKLDPFDVSAATYARKTDYNEEAALVKISLPLKNVEINGNTVGSIEQVNGEYWVYLDPGSISLTLTGADGKDIEVRFADFGISSVGKSCTYKLECKLSEAEQKSAFENNKRKEKTEFKTPRHLSVAYKFKGERFFMTHEEWLQQSEDLFFNIDIEGLVIEFGGKKFIYTKRPVEDANSDLLVLNWDDTQKYLKNHPDERLLTKAEAEYLLSIGDDFNKANAAGHDGGAPYFTSGMPGSWLADFTDGQEVWFVEGALDFVGTADKSTERCIHTVIDIKE